MSAKQYYSIHIIMFKFRVYGKVEQILVGAVGRSENPGVPVLYGGHNLPPLVEIGLIDLAKSRGWHDTHGTIRDDRPVLMNVYFHFFLVCNISISEYLLFA